MRPSALLTSLLTVIALGACGDSDEPKRAGGSSPNAGEPGTRTGGEIPADKSSPSAGERAISPARKIAFTREGSGPNPDFFFDIWLMNADGSGQTNLTRTSQIYEDSPAWSPDGQRIAFARSENRRTHDIWVMNANGSEQTKLTETPKLDEGGPAWSPDGKRIIFQRINSGGGPEGQDTIDIYVMNANGSDVTRLTETPNAYEGSPAWSPNGQSILFTRSFRLKHDPPVGIYAMRTDGSGERLLTRGPIFDEVIPGGATFSPDGKHIAFEGLREGDQAPRVWLMDSDGGDPAPLRRARSGLASTPSFSPDGQRIAFEGHLPPGIYVINIDGENPTALTYNRPNERHPAWSPVPAGRRGD